MNMNCIEKEWINFLEEIYYNGYKHTKDDNDKLLEIIDNHCFLPNIIKEQYGSTHKITLPIFLNLIDKGMFNIQGYFLKDKSLGDYVRSLDDPKQIILTEENGELPFVYTYPERLQHILLSDRDGNTDFYNQISIICDRLKTSQGSNRAVATLYSAGLDYNETHIPCLQWIQCLIRDDELTLYVMFRSNDCYGAFPSNMLFLQYLGLKITDKLRVTYPNIEFKGVSYNSTSLHVYETDWTMMEKILKENNRLKGKK